MQTDLTPAAFLLFIPQANIVVRVFFSAKFFTGGIFQSHEMHYKSLKLLKI